TTDLPGASAAITVPPTVRFSISGAPASKTAGQSFNVVVTALMANGSTDTTYRGTIHFSSTDVAAGLPTDYTCAASDNGTHTVSVTLNVAGSRTVTVADTTLATAKGTSGPVKVTPGPVVPATHFSISNMPSSRTAGQSFNIVVRALTATNQTA